MLQCCVALKIVVANHGVPCNITFTDSRLIRTPRYDGQFAFNVPEQGFTFSLNSTRLIRTPVNVDNGQLFLAQSADSLRKPTSLMRTLHL